MRRPHPGGTLASIRARWRSLSVFARRRLVAVAGLVVMIALLAAVAVPGLPCQLPGGDACAPADDAAELVPAQALAYLHANLDLDSEQYERARELAAAVPRFSGELIDRVTASLAVGDGSPPDFEQDIRPWFGGELAVAVLDQGFADERVVILEVSDSEGADELAAELAAPGAEAEDHEGVELRVDDDGFATARVEGFLAAGPQAAVRAVIDTATGAEGTSSLADDDAAAEVRDELPGERFADAYLSKDGVDELVGDRRGSLATLAPLVAPGSSRGVAASLGAGDDDDLELALRSALDAERAESAPGFFAAFPGFDPALPARLPSEALGYVGIGDPGETVGALLDQAGSAAPGIARGFDDLAASLRRHSKVEIEAEILEALGDEAAFTLTPAAAAQGGAGAPPAPPTSLPHLGFVADDVDEERIRGGLAALQGPLVDAVAPALGLRPSGFSELDLGGVEASSLRISPAVELTYAVFDGLAAVATDPAAIELLAGGEGGLDAAELYRRATRGFADEVSLLAFLDLDRLVDLGESLGLAEDPVYAAFAGGFRRLDALAVAVAAEEELLATDARLIFGEEQQVEPPASPLGPAGD